MSRIKCLVTGGFGFIGSHVVELLTKHGYEVTVIDNLSTSKQENIDVVKSILPEEKCLKLDITSEEDIASLAEFDYVFHFAALARIQPSIDDPVTAHEANVNGTLNLLEYCRQNKAKIIFSSSSSVYGDAALPTDEFSPTDPKSPYSLQKLICEQYIKLYGDLYDLDYTILRYFNVFGERQILEGAYAAVVGILLNQKVKGQPLTITNDGEQRRDFTYVKDVAMANIMAMDWPKEIVNIGTGHNYSINELANAIGGERQYIGNRPGEAKATLADRYKAKNLGWKPTITILDWIKTQL